MAFALVAPITLQHLHAQKGGATISELQRISDAHLRPEDLALFERVTGGSVAALLRHEAWQKTSRSTMKKIMGINKVVAHPLNAYGLHALRSLLSERIADHVRKSRGFSVNHALHDRFMRDGILIFPDVQNASSTLEGLFAANDREVERVLRMVSGFKRLGADGFTSWDAHTHVVTDPQYYMHVDTYHPSMPPDAHLRVAHAHSLTHPYCTDRPFLPTAPAVQPGRSLCSERPRWSRVLSTMCMVPTAAAAKVRCGGFTIVRERWFIRGRRH